MISFYSLLSYDTGISIFVCAFVTSGNTPKLSKNSSSCSANLHKLSEKQNGADGALPYFIALKGNKFESTRALLSVDGAVPPVFKMQTSSKCGI